MSKRLGLARNTLPAAMAALNWACCQAAGRGISHLRRSGLGQKQRLLRQAGPLRDFDAFAGHRNGGLVPMETKSRGVAGREFNRNLCRTSD
jgi:hypothetical protein